MNGAVRTLWNILSLCLGYLCVQLRDIITAAAAAAVVFPSFILLFVAGYSGEREETVETLYSDHCWKSGSFLPFWILHFFFVVPCVFWCGYFFGCCFGLLLLLLLLLLANELTCFPYDFFNQATFAAAGAVRHDWALSSSFSSSLAATAACLSLVQPH